MPLQSSSRLLLLSASGLLLLLSACAPQPRAPVGTPASVPAMPSAPLLPPGVDLTGSWYVGTGAEPAARTITLQPSCAQNPAVWLLRQTGNQIEAWTFPATFNQGIVRPGPGQERIRPARGTISGVTVVLDDDGASVVMVYDSASGHLRGARDRSPFWAVRQVVVRTQCPGIP